MKKIFSLSLLALSLTACSVFSPYGTSNIPAPATVGKYTPQVAPKQLWQANVGSASNGAFLQLAPCTANGVIYNMDQKGRFFATNTANGNSLWKFDNKIGGKSNLATDGNLIAFVDEKANLHVISTDKGKQVWQTTLTDQALAAPTFTNNLVIAKAIDGTVTAYDRATGKELWQYQHDVPSLMLRASSAVVVVGNVGYVGFADGKVIALDLSNGDEIWSQQAAEPQGFAEIERLVDIDANLIVRGDRLYVATYQGQISALDRNSGKILWQQANSVYADITIDNTTLYAVNADGTMSAYALNSGKQLWQQKTLAWHFLTGPALYQNMLVVGDVTGNLYFIKPQTGELLGNLPVFKKTNILNTPLIINQALITIDTQGKMVAVTV